MIVHAAESDTNSQYCFLGLSAGTSANLGQIAVGGGANAGREVHHRSRRRTRRRRASIRTGTGNTRKCPASWHSLTCRPIHRLTLGTKCTHRVQSDARKHRELLFDVDGEVYRARGRCVRVQLQRVHKQRLPRDGYRQLALMMESPSKCPTLTFQPMDQNWLAGSTNYGATHFTTVTNARARE